MEGVHYDPESHWSPKAGIRFEYGGQVFALRWGDTTVHRHDVEDGVYDYLEHTPPDGENLQIFMDETDLGEDLDARGYRVIRQGYVGVDVVEARRDHEAELAGDEFAADLETVKGPEDLLA